jgi:hypothetical protein
MAGPRLGGSPTAFGLEEWAPRGVKMAQPGLVVQWDSPDRRAIVTGIAELWDTGRRDRFVASGHSLRSLADDFMRAWGPPDARPVHASRQGGTQVVLYRSAALARLLPPASGGQAPAEDLSVLINLDTSISGAGVPLTPRQPEADAPDQRTFTVAVIVGHPWDGGR